MDPVKLPDFFPYCPKACQKESKTFMDCFSKHAQKINETDTNAGVDGLSKCLKEKSFYETCMKKFESKKEPRRFRVQDEYRNK